MENLFHNYLKELKQLLKSDEAERDNLLDIITDFELMDEDAIEEIYNFLIELNVRKSLPLPPDERLREYCNYLLLFFSNNPYILTNI